MTLKEFEDMSNLRWTQNGKELVLKLLGKYQISNNRYQMCVVCV